MPGWARVWVKETVANNNYSCSHKEEPCRETAQSDAPLSKEGACDTLSGRRV